MSDFDALMAQLDPAMAIVTTTNGRERAGCLIGFHAQSGLEPHSLTIWLSKANHTYRVGATSDVFAVHFLATDDLGLAALFGTETGDQVDKFSRCEWHEGTGGVPVLDRVGQRVIGRKEALLETSADHVCVVLDPEDVTYRGPFEALRLSDVRHLEPGHEAEERPEPASARAPET